MVSGYPDLPPSSPSPYSHPDVSCNPLHAVVAILAALRHRRRTGQGQLIELAQYESTICWTGPAILQFTVNGRLAQRPGNAHPLAAPHDTYRCAGEDAWCAIAIFDETQWKALCRTIERLDLVADPAYASAQARRERESELRDVIQSWTSERTPEQAMSALQHAGVPCAALNDFEGLLRGDPQLRARGLWTEVDHPELGKALIEGWGFKTADPPPESRRAPLLGEHNDLILQEILGLSEEEVNRQFAADVLR